MRDVQKISNIDKPAYMEIDINEERMSISFSFLPQAFESILQKFQMKPWICSEYERQGLSLFISPKNGKWGFGEVFSRNDRLAFNDGWPTLELLLPTNPKMKILCDIAGSIHVLTTAISISESEFETYLAGNALQLMVIDGFNVATDITHQNCALDFTFSRLVLDFCKKIWSKKEEHYQAVIKCMMQVYSHLKGRKLSPSEIFDFYLSMTREDPRQVSLHCPGD